MIRSLRLALNHQTATMSADNPRLLIQLRLALNHQTATMWCARLIGRTQLRLALNHQTATIGRVQGGEGDRCGWPSITRPLQSICSSAQCSNGCGWPSITRPLQYTPI